MIVFVAQFLRHHKADSTSPKIAGCLTVDRSQLTTLKMLRTRQFYFMYVMFVLMANGGLLVTANAGPIARSWGYSAELLALAATLSPLANGGSRIFWGWVSDRLGRESTMVTSFTLQ